MNTCDNNSAPSVLLADAASVTSPNSAMSTRAATASTDEQIPYPHLDQDQVLLADRRAPLVIRQDADRGRGIYTTTELPAHTLIDVAPVLLMSELRPPFDHYTFCWPGPRPHALALGIGSLLNHSAEPNAYFLRDIPNGLVRFFTLKPVPAGEELFISYGENLWFDDADAEQHTAATPLENETIESFFQSFDRSDDDNNSNNGLLIG
ncbi:hypothetical protein BDF19DRAFT_439034 [Syncephalis fuscata]|nr:hypothetical protein BDF19DRAFT_439034 [Syncephalis fuscata]